MTNLFRIPILLFTLGGLENSRLVGSDAALSQSCLRMLWEEGDHECKIILPCPTPNHPASSPPSFELGDFFFFNSEFPGSWWEHGDEALGNLID